MSVGNHKHNIGPSRSVCKIGKKHFNQNIMKIVYLVEVLIQLFLSIS